MAFQFLQFVGQAGGTGADRLEGRQAVGIEVGDLLLQLLEAIERFGLAGDGRPAHLSSLFQLLDGCRLGVVLDALKVHVANSGQRQNAQHKLGSGHIHRGITSRT
ncbi:hypothetical protein [Pseudomonas sp. C5pp]|uniref:hypothetical protein n=1 Tax=Pseudomonas sp. C5pp TaxID=1586081 RepID=UPI003FA6D729